MGVVAILTIINQVVAESGTLTPLVISAISELESLTGRTINDLLDEAQIKHDLDVTKIQRLLDETA